MKKNVVNLETFDFVATAIRDKRFPSIEPLGLNNAKAFHSQKAVDSNANIFICR